MNEIRLSAPRVVAGIALLASPSVAFASDPRGLAVLVYGALAVVFAVVYVVIWLLTRRLSRPWLKTWIRVAVICFFWTPVPYGGAGYWWPAPIVLLGMLGDR